MSVNWNDLLIEITTFFENCEIKYKLAECVASKDLKCLIDRILTLSNNTEVRDFVITRLRKFPEIADAIRERVSFKI